MKMGITNFCNGQGSTSTLDQHCPSVDALLGRDFSDDNVSHPQALPTLEEMILRLEIEEAIARKSRLKEESYQRRRSCINSSDHILQSAKNALNQYPRFSLDGKDAMWRSSFGNFTPAIHEEMPQRYVSGARRRRRGVSHCSDLGVERKPPPLTVGGEAVVWCNPGVVAKLMGLDALPVPLGNKGTSRRSRSLHEGEKRAEKWDSESRRLGRRDHHDAPKLVGGGNLRSGLRPKCCVLKPISLDHMENAAHPLARQFK